MQFRYNVAGTIIFGIFSLYLHSEEIFSHFLRDIIHFFRGETGAIFDNNMAIK